MDGLDLRSKRPEDLFETEQREDSALRSNEISSSRKTCLSEEHEPHCRPCEDHHTEFRTNFLDDFREIGFPPQQCNYPTQECGFDLHSTNSPLSTYRNQLQSIGDTHHSGFMNVEWNLMEKADYRITQPSSLRGDNSRHRSSIIDKMDINATSNALIGDFEGVVTDKHKPGSSCSVSEIVNPTAAESNIQSSMTSSSIHNSGVLGYQPFVRCCEDAETNLLNVATAIESNKSPEQRLIQLESDKVGKITSNKCSVSEPTASEDCSDSTNVQKSQSTTVNDGHTEIPSCLTLNLPLEVIGACWFMQRDSETALQAVTSTDDEITVHLTKKDGRVSLAFKAVSPTGKPFEQKLNHCNCHVRALLEPARKPVAVESTSSPAPSSSFQDIGMKATAGNTLNTIRSGTSDFINKTSLRKCAKPYKGIEYDDLEDETEDIAVKTTTDGFVCEDEESSEGNDDDLVTENDDFYPSNDEGERIESYVEEPSQRKPLSNSLRQRRKSSPKKNLNMAKEDDDDDEIDDDDEDDDDCGSDDYEWKPSKRAKLIKLSRSGLRLKVKVKSEPEVLYAEEVQEVGDIGNDSESDEMTDEDLDGNDANVEVDKQSGVISSIPLAGTLSKQGCRKFKISHEGNTRLKTRHQKNVDGPKWEKKGNCPHCGVFYGNLNQHIGLYCPKNPNRQRAYHCCYCKFRSLDRAQLIEHKATHVLARDFKCEICDSAFFTRQRLVRHMRYVHLLGTNPVRIYTCDRCGKRFRYHSHYDRHLTIHSEEKTAQCDKCGKFFKNSHNVRNHQSRMHPGKPESFAFYCDKCGQGAHSMTAHRCVVPGEMHGSRRRRAPRQSLAPTSSSHAITDDQAQPAQVQHALPSSSPSSPIVVDQNPRSPQPVLAVRRGAVDDCLSSASQCPPPADYRSTNFLFPPADMDIRSTVGNSRRITSSQQEDRYASSPAQSFPRHTTFDPHLPPHHPLHMSESRLSAGQNHAMLAPPGVDSSHYDRRLFDHHLPALAHQSQQQPPYSNLFVVDPLLRAANMMYRSDY